MEGKDTREAYESPAVTDLGDAEELTQQACTNPC